MSGFALSVSIMFLLLQASTADDRSGDSVIGWPSERQVSTPGCIAEAPGHGWTLPRCDNGSLQVKVLSYNLFWWNLFGLRNGDAGSAGHLISSTSWPKVYDLLALQDCKDVRRLLEDGRLQHQFEDVSSSKFSLCFAYHRAAWQMLDHGEATVGEDEIPSSEGATLFRGSIWLRLLHRATARIIFAVNHQGPMPLGSGGKCGGEAVAYNILKLIANHAHKTDAVLVLGDFKANSQSSVATYLRHHLDHQYSGTALGGVDHIFGCRGSKSLGSFNLGSGGSSHDAISALLSV